MFKSNYERKMRYSIRKFSIGVASVVVASLFMGSVVHATEKVSANPPIPQIVSPSDKKEYEDAVQRVNKEISDYVTSRLDSLDRSVSGFSEIVTKVQVVVDKYRDKIDRVTTKSMVEELGREVEKKIDEEIKLFQNHSGSKSTPKEPSLNDGLRGGDAPSVGQQGEQPSKPVLPLDSSKPKTPVAGNQSDKPAPSLSDTKEVQDLIKKGFQELEKLEKSLQELDEKAELPDEEFYGKQKTIWDDSKNTIRQSIKDFKDIVKDRASRYHKENYFKKYTSDFKDYQLYVQMEIMTRQVRDYLLRYPKDGDIIKEFESGMKQTASDNYSNLSGDSLKGYFEKNFRSAFEKIQETVRKLEKKAPAPKTPEKPQKSEQLKPSKPTEQDKVAEAQKKVEEAEKKAKIQKEKDHRNYPTNTRKTIELEIAEAQVGVAKAELELAQAQAQTPQDTDTINAAKAKVEAAKSNVKKLEKIKSDSEKSQAGAQKPTTPAPDTKPNHQSQPEGKQPSTPKEPENKKPSVPTPEKPIPQPEKPKPEVKPTPETPEVKPVPQPAPPKTSKIFTASDGKTKVAVVFDKAVDADKVNIKEVTTKELADKIARKTGGGTVRVFDLSLSKGGKETHVNGERTVRLALGQTGSDVHVYHVKENGDLERIPSKVENGQVVFKTNHFSLFAIKTLSKNQNVTTPKQTKPSIQDSQTQIGESQTGKFQNKEVNPKPLATGNETMAKENPTSATEKKLPSTGAATNLVLEIIGLLGLAGTSLIAMKRRK